MAEVLLGMHFTEQKKEKQKYSSCRCAVNDMEGIHTGYFRQVLNPDPTPVEESDNE